MSRVPFATVLMMVIGVMIGCDNQKDGEPTCPTGTEDCPCYGNNTCNQGLVCISELCVKESAADGDGDGDSFDSPDHEYDVDGDFDPDTEAAEEFDADADKDAPDSDDFGDGEKTESSVEDGDETEGEDSDASLCVDDGLCCIGGVPHNNGITCTDDGDPCTNDICQAGICDHIFNTDLPECLEGMSIYDGGMRVCGPTVQQSSSFRLIGASQGGPQKMLLKSNSYRLKAWLGRSSN